MVTIFEVNKLARQGTEWPNTPPKVHAHHSPVVVTYTDAGWSSRPDGTSREGQLVFIENAELLRGKESNMSLITWHSSRLKRVARSSSAAETQAAADGDDETVYMRFSLKQFCLGSLICSTCKQITTNSCCSGRGLSLFVYKSWFEGQGSLAWSACPQTNLCSVWYDDTLVSCC